MHDQPDRRGSLRQRQRDDALRLSSNTLALTRAAVFDGMARARVPRGSGQRQTAGAARLRRYQRSSWSARLGATALLLQLSACSWFHFFSAPAPAGTYHLTGTLNVAPAHEFAYMPARSGHVSPNRIENTAVSSIVIKQDIDEAVRANIVHELQLAGIHVAEGARVLSGTIEGFSVDDLRSPAQWTLTIRYVVTDTATGNVIYEATKTVQHQSPKFTSNSIAISDIVKSSVGALIRDPAFAKTVN